MFLSNLIQSMMLQELDACGNTLAVFDDPLERRRVVRIQLLESNDGLEVVGHFPQRSRVLIQDSFPSHSFKFLLTFFLQVQINWWCSKWVFCFVFFQYKVTLSFHNLFAGRKTQNRRDKGSRLVHLNSFSIQADSKLHFKHRSLLRGLQKFTFLKGWCFKSHSRSS